MGSRSSATLKEIDGLRSGLDEKLAELERRLPPAAQLGRRALAVTLGGGASGTLLWMGVRRLRARRKQPAPSPSPAPVVVNVLPGGAVPVAAAAVAVWAGVRLYEAVRRPDGEGGGTGSRPAPITSLREGERRNPASSA